MPASSTPPQKSSASALRALYSPEHAAHYLDVSRATIFIWLAQGRLTGFRVGRLRRFSRAELDRLAAELEADGLEAV